MFCGDVELGSFLATILDVLVPCEFGAISDQTCVSYNIYTGPSEIQILDFQCSRDYTTRFLNRGFDLVSSDDHKVVNFIATDDNPTFLINKAAVELFVHLHKDFEELENKVKDKRLVVTGVSLGGYIAILFTLWLHSVIDVKRKSDSKKTTRPICITFGSPLVGDKALESAVSERPEWKSSFVSVVSTMDPFACFFSSGSLYEPFGTFLFCTESGGHTAFEDSEAILAVLDNMQASSRSGSNPRSFKQMHDYIDELSLVRNKVFYRGVCELPEELSSNALRAGITLQFREISMFEVSNDLINKLVEGKHEKMRKIKDTYSDVKKLNKRKIKIVIMELFISSTRSGAGYYDCYKSETPRDANSVHNEVIKIHRSLNQYWEGFIKEKKLMPQKEDANLRKRWLYGGNNYRKMFEPLDIVEYYKRGNTKYMENRPNHYKLLEKWWNEDIKHLNPNKRKGKSPNVNDDSCFWARVEEAFVSLSLLTNGSSSSNGHETEQELYKFMAYVMDSVRDHSLSSDIFLENSSLMKWWSEYNSYKKDLCNSAFAKYMKSGKYKSYV